MDLNVAKLRLYLSSFVIMSLLAVLVVLPRSASSQVVLDSVPELRDVTIDEHLGSKVPLNLVFTDQNGRRVTLGDYFKAGKPVILNLAYYECPMLCSIVLNGVGSAVKQLDWLPGDKFEMVVVSFNPRETYSLAAAKRENYLKELNRPGADWTFLVGDSSQSQALANALGFKYFYDEKTHEYAHTAAAFILTPDGTISRYLYGIEFNPKDVRLALLEASKGEIGTTLDKLILYCYHYDPNAKGYVVMATNVMRIGGVMSVGLLALFLALLWRSDRHSKAGKDGTLVPHPHSMGNGR